MKEKLIEKILGILLILAAFYSRDFSNWKGISVFIIMNLAGWSNIWKSSDSEFYRKLSYVFGRTAFTISIIVITAMILGG